MFVLHGSVAKNDYNLSSDDICGSLAVVAVIAQHGGRGGKARRSAVR